MYTSSSDHGSTWSAPVNVNPERANDAHMFPCLSCNKDGDILGGSMVYDQALEKYLILRHTKAHNETAWTTTETDNGPWTAAGPSPGFRIGFGDYFDCDSLPVFGISVMAWSETANGQQPWQSWVRIVNRWQWEDDRVGALEDRSHGKHGLGSWILYAPVTCRRTSVASALATHRGFRTQIVWFGMRIGSYDFRL